MKNLKLKAARAEKDLSQADLAESRGIQADNQRNRERGL